MHDDFTGCALNFHKRCAIKVPSNCSGGALQVPASNGKRRRSSTLNVPRSPSESGSTSSLASTVEENVARASVSIGSGAGIPHTFALHTYTRPTICGSCKKLLKGLFKQGVQCKDCQYNAHKKCIEKIPKDCPGENPKDPGKFKKFPCLF